MANRYSQLNHRIQRNVQRVRSIDPTKAEEAEALLYQAYRLHALASRRFKNQIRKLLTRADSLVSA